VNPSAHTACRTDRRRCLAIAFRHRRRPHAAAKIQRLVSARGIEAWFVQDATVPLIAMEYSSAAARARIRRQARCRNMVADLLD